LGAFRSIGCHRFSMEATTEVATWSGVTVARCSLLHRRELAAGGGSFSAIFGSMRETSYADRNGSVGGGVMHIC
jgi:hypothetical protein